MKSLKVFLLSFMLVFVIGLVVTADKVAGAEEIEKAVNLDEDIQPADLEVSEPRLLTDSPFYFLKNWARGIQNFFTLNPIKRAELKLKFANEKLMEAKKIVEKTKDPEIIKKATENYQKEIEEIKNRVKEIKEKAKDNPEVESFLDKFIHQQTLHLKLLDRLETQVPPEVFEKIKEARERHLERFQDVMLKLEDRPEKITEKLDKILQEQKGSQFKEFKNLEVLKNLEEKVPEEAKEAIRKAEENALKRLEENFEKMSPENQERFERYLQKISGKKERHLEILENLKQELKKPAVLPLSELEEKLEKDKKAKKEMLEKLEKGREEILKEIKTRVEQGIQVPPGCPKITLEIPECPEGRIIEERKKIEGESCLVGFMCVVTGEMVAPPVPPDKEKPIPPVPPDKEKPIPPVPPPFKEKPGPRYCITLWDPVCGEDGKTYSNACFAEMAGVGVAYKGVCKEEVLPGRRKMRIECYSDIDCRHLICPQVIGQDTPRCDLETKTCYCGPK